MDYSHPEYALQARPSGLQNEGSALRKVFINDPGLITQILLTIPIIAGGIVLNINTIQWILVILVTLLFLVAGIFRTAALLQINYDSSLSPFHVTRIKCMGTAGVVITSGISLFTYMMVFVPRILLFL